MRIKIMRDFHYGSVSDPQKMIAGNTVEVPELGWVEIQEAVD
jgi:hypothetical protein